MAIERDPLSVEYDGATGRLLDRAARASRSGRGVQAWIASPRGEFRARDRGGRTRHERAFTRSAYYRVWRVPINRGEVPEWSLKLTWGGDETRKPSSRGRLARPVVIRLYPRSEARVSGPKWAGTELQSQMGRRIDDLRPAPGMSQGGPQRGIGSHQEECRFAPRLRPRAGGDGAGPWNPLGCGD